VKLFVNRQHAFIDENKRIYSRPMSNEESSKFNERATIRLN